MRIISDFHDYYDCVQKMGQDLNTVYIRKRKEVNLDMFPFSNFLNKFRGWEGIYPKIYIVGFCGKIYPVMCVNKDLRKKQ